ncbi:MAG: hypothetical protein M1835_007667 [Candelina submexicana]|nr:MAG: hypothetical protein M1835_007667 [Candelina submexicana]
MAPSTDSGNYFQTETSIEETQRKAKKSTNNAGNPIKLSSKILAVAEDPTNPNRVYVAESAGTVRRVVLEVCKTTIPCSADLAAGKLIEITGEKSHIYRGPTAPVTCLALAPEVIYAGCWDKAIWSWDINTRAPRRKYVGHSDFVKASLYVKLGERELLVSGGADATIIVWDTASGDKLHTLKGHARGIQDLAIDPTTLVPDSVAIFSASSDREIRQWTISAEQAAAETANSKPIIAHETSVYKLHFDASDDLWTASADNTAKCLSRERSWQADTELLHPDFVRDVLVDENGGWVITACRDEEIRVWDRSTGKLHHTFSGHFEEVTGLVLIEQTLVSVSIDATIRQWSLKPGDLQAAKLAAEEEGKKDVEIDEEEIGAAGKPSLLTEDEERELAELMDDSG